MTVPGPPPASHGAAARAGATRPARPVRVVLVEDHDALRGQLRGLLQGAGYHVVAAAGSMDAGRDAVRRLVPGVLVTDNRLPDGSGIELCGLVRAELPTVMVIVYSAQLGPGDDERARRAGAIAAVQKSMRGTELLAALRSITGGGGPQSNGSCAIRSTTRRGTS